MPSGPVLDMSAVLEASGLTKRFGNAVAVDGLSLSVARGEIFGLVGPDGAGKTTTMRLLTGVMSATAGSATVLGVDVTREPEAIRHRIGYVPQSSSLYADLTALENLRFYADLFGVPRVERNRRAQELLALSRLTPFASRLARNLSGGMRQKLALCAALIHRPEVLFLDEPTIGVDPVSRRDFWLLIYQLLQQGLTLVVSTPYLDEAERCHRVGLMNRGRLVACDAPSALRRLLPGALLEVRGVPADVALGLLERVPEVRDVEVFGETLHVSVGDAGAALPAIRAALDHAGLRDTGLRQIPPSLEDVFIAVLRQGPPQAGVAGRPGGASGAQRGSA
jgi:ABC-2 type transport system ATP-binding protein